MKTHINFYFSIQVLILALLMLLGTGCQAVRGIQADGALAAALPTATPEAMASSSTPPDGSFSGAIRDVAHVVSPAIVQITNEQVQLGQFNQAFTIPSGVGSGVIYDAQGHILTNNHVVAGAQKLLVSLPDGRSFPAKLVGQDPLTDLAVVQIQANNLPVAKLGDSTQLQVGDWVVAIGNALALPGGPTVTAGLVSALGRTVQEPGGNSGPGPFLFNVIQTDAPINPGNSGGALINLAGEVVGINTLVAGQAASGIQAQGIGFAIAISTAKPIADQLVANGKIIHPYMGVSYVPLNPAIAAYLGIQETQGVVIASVVSGSPADQAGLKANDVITKVDGQTLKGDSDLAQIINDHKPGDTLTLTVVRGTQNLQLKVKLADMPASLQ